MKKLGVTWKVVKRISTQSDAGVIDELNTTLILWIFSIVVCGVMVGLIASALFSDVNSLVTILTNLF